MSPALAPLRKLQFGFESTAGTLVAATQQVTGDAMLTEQIERYMAEYPRGVRAPVTGGGVDVQKGVELSVATELDYEQMLYPLLTGLIDDAVPTGVGPYIWEIYPALTAAPALRALTCEYVIDDGSTKHVEREAGYGICRRFGISLAADQIAQLNFDMFFRTSQTSTMTAALSPLTRAPVPSALFKFYMDDTWANLGTTQKTGFLRSADLEVITGQEPDYTLDGRSDLDFTGPRTSNLDATLGVTAEMTADAATEIANYRSGTVRFVRLIANNGGVTTAEREIQIDMAVKHLAPPVFSQDAGIEIVTFSLGLEYDSTGAKALEFKVTNGLATLT